MARKKTIASETLTQPGKVRVKEERTYIQDIQPGEVDSELELEDDDELDPLSEFEQVVDPTDNYTLHVWRLPNYDADHRTSPNGSVREFCGSFPYTKGDDNLFNVIRAQVPQGGTVLLELRCSGKVVSRGTMKLAPIPGMQQVQQPVHTTPGGPLVVMHQQPQNQPSQPPAPPQDPMHLAEQGMTFAVKLVDMAQKLAPQPAPVTINPAPEKQEVDFEQEIYKAAASEIFKSDDKDLKIRMIEAMGGRRSNSSGIMDTLGEIAKAIMPMAMQFGMAYLRNQQAASGQPVTPPTPAEQAQLPPASPAFNVPDNPGDRAWFFCVRHLFENCTNGMPAKGTAGEICDVLDAHQHLEPIVEPVLMAETPELAVDLLALVDPRCEQLKGHASALAWVAKVQEEAKGMMADAQEGEEGAL